MRWEDALKKSVQPQFEQVEHPEPPYTLSCKGYRHEPPCGSYLAHLRRWQAEREAAGGEAQLKAKVEFWKRLDWRA